MSKDPKLGPKATKVVVATLITGVVLLFIGLMLFLSVRYNCTCESCICATIKQLALDLLAFGAVFTLITIVMMSMFDPTFKR